MVKTGKLYAKCLKESFKYTGRSSSAEYWAFFWVNLAVGVVWLLGLIGTTAAKHFDASLVSLRGWLWALFAYGVLMTFPNVALSVRRLHDLNRSGRYVWPLVAVAVLSWICLFCGYAGYMDLLSRLPVFPAVILGAFAKSCSVYNFVLAVILLFKDGDVGANQFGEDPSDKPDRKPPRKLPDFLPSGLFFLTLFAGILVGNFQMKKCYEVEDLCADRCCDSLQALGSKVLAYAEGHEGALPDDFAILPDEKDHRGRHICCPKQWEKIGVFKNAMKDGKYELSEKAAGVSLSEIESPESFPLVTCTKHRGKKIVLYADGHVQTVSLKSLRRHGRHRAK